MTALIALVVLLGLTAISLGLAIWHDRRQERREQQRGGDAP